MYGLSAQKMAVIEVWPLWRGGLVIRGGSTDYIILLLVNKNYGMPYSGGSDWLSKEAHIREVCNLAVLGSSPADRAQKPLIG